MRQGERMLLDIGVFCEAGGGLRLRGYQRRVAQALVESVFQERGLSLAVLFPRQSGKNELQAQVEAYLLLMLAYRGAEIVKISPTWQPQAQNAMHRLERVLNANFMTRAVWEKENGYIYRIGRARITFLSGAPEANVVGATASTLLEVDEAQDVQVSKYDKDIAPMAASTNATRVFWGTAWTATTLLARELRAAQAAEAEDGRPRSFVLTAREVAAEVPAYGRFVAGQVARLGREHPLVKTQFFSEELDGVTGMFPVERIARMFAAGGEAAGGGEAAVGCGRANLYALLIDVAGQDPAVGSAEESASAGGLANPRRDSTAVTVVQIDLAGLADPLLRAPIYRPVARQQWVGVSQTLLYDQILALAAHWQASRLVVDATGVGAGLASFLERALPGRVHPFVFTQASKSRLGWDFLAVVDGGRWREAPRVGLNQRRDDLAAVFCQQLAFCRCEVLPGPNQNLRWGVPDNARDPHTGARIHDDLLISAALSAVLDQESWSAPAPGPLHIIRAKDPLTEMRGF